MYAFRKELQIKVRRGTAFISSMSWDLIGGYSKKS
jgi:hypothetical protein